MKCTVGRSVGISRAHQQKELSQQRGRGETNAISVRKFVSPGAAANLFEHAHIQRPGQG